MPIYEYECGTCGVFTAGRPMSEYQLPHVCPECGTLSPRALVTAPAFAGMPAVARTAHALNEKAKHEPQTNAERAAGHGPGCGCCGNKSMPSRTVKTKDGSKAFPSARPWMISH